MRLALLSDIHANQEALEAVLADLAAREIDQIAFLGDIVGYGPDPQWCVETVADLVTKGALCLRGNHDRAVGLPDGAFNPNARRVIDWTVNRLSRQHKAFLADLPLVIEDGDLMLVHASANDPADWIYVNSETKALGSFSVTKARLIFCGHVHRPQLYSSDLSGKVTSHPVIFAHPLPLIRSRRWLGVIGSVGQPRDGVAQASYAILDRDANSLTFRRVGYDVMTTARKMRAAGLPEVLASRLMKGE